MVSIASAIGDSKCSGRIELCLQYFIVDSRGYVFFAIMGGVVSTLNVLTSFKAFSTFLQ
ncbi:hypothetical protein PMAG_b0199 [Pseudoalteromonas mariniglutinosa NCIMB 1770]|nr:hypothetical protein [Pseudoalteromonas mariniglutinosa NCIMB 1770]